MGVNSTDGCSIRHKQVAYDKDQPRRHGEGIKTPGWCYERMLTRYVRSDHDNSQAAIIGGRMKLSRWGRVQVEVWGTGDSTGTFT